MVEIFNIQIAGISFSVKTKAEITLLNPGLSSYKSFIRTAGRNETNPADMEIDLELSEIDTDKFTTIFDSGQSWSMLRYENNIYISNHSPKMEKPLWVAKLNHKLTQSTIYCSDQIIQKQGNTAAVLNPMRYPLDQIMLMHILAEKEGLLIHAAGAVINGTGFVFPGKSGAGKSTLSKQFEGEKNIKLLSDDRIIIRKINEEFRAFGTPWPGEAGIALNESAPLKAICFIRHGTSSSIEKLKPNKALKNLMPVTSIPWYDRKSVQELLSFCEDIISNIPAYDLYFTPDKKVLNILDELALS